MRFYREYYIQLNALASTLAVRYPQDRRVVELYAKHLIASGELEQALALYKLHLDDQPPVEEYFRSVIDIESYLQHPDSVNLYIGRALELFPGEIDFHLSKGHVLNYTKQYDKAIKAYQQSLRYAHTDSLRSVIWGFIGDTWHQKAAAGESGDEEDFVQISRKGSFRADMKQCYKAYDRSLRYDPDNAMVLNNYAYFLSLEERELEKALTMASRATPSRTTTPPTWTPTLGCSSSWDVWPRPEGDAAGHRPRRAGECGAAGSLRGYPACAWARISWPRYTGAKTRKGLRRLTRTRRMERAKPKKSDRDEARPHTDPPFPVRRLYRCGAGGPRCHRRAEAGIAALEQKIAAEEREISKIQGGPRRHRGAHTVWRASSTPATSCSKRPRSRCACCARRSTVRTASPEISAGPGPQPYPICRDGTRAYRNYKHNNYLTYIFSSRDFADIAKKITNLREVASMRERKLHDIAALSNRSPRRRSCSTAANGRSTR